MQKSCIFITNTYKSLNCSTKNKIWSLQDSCEMYEAMSPPSFRGCFKLLKLLSAITTTLALKRFTLTQSK